MISKIKTKSSYSRYLRENLNWILLFLMIVYAFFFTNGFFTSSNLANLFRRVSINGIMTIGFSVVLLTGGFDLSIGAILSLCAVIALGIEPSMGPVLSILIPIIIGTLLGMLNGFLMKLTRGETGEAFLITLGTGLIAASVALTYTKGRELYGAQNEFMSYIGSGNLLGIPVSAFIWIVAMIIVQFFLKKTISGKHVILCGANKKAAFVSGVNIGKIKFWAFTFAGTMASIAALLLVAKQASASPRSGDGADFDAAIASIVGGNSLIGGKGGMIQVFIGVMIYGLITNITNLAGISTVYQYIIRGLVLIIAILLDNFKER